MANAFEQTFSICAGTSNNLASASMTSRGSPAIPPCSLHQPAKATVASYSSAFNPGTATLPLSDAAAILMTSVAPPPSPSATVGVTPSGAGPHGDSTSPNVMASGAGASVDGAVESDGASVEAEVFGVVSSPRFEQAVRTTRVDVIRIAGSLRTASFCRIDSRPTMSNRCSWPSGRWSRAGCANYSRNIAEPRRGT